MKEYYIGKNRIKDGSPVITYVFTVIALIICLITIYPMYYLLILMVPIFIFSIFTYNNALQKNMSTAVMQCEQDANNTISLIDEQLLNVQTISGKVNMLSWVWKLSVEGDMFVSYFDAVRKKEIINDLKILVSENGLIGNMVLIFGERDVVISQYGWFNIDSFFSFLGNNDKAADIKNRLNERYLFEILYPNELVLKNRSVFWLIHSIDLVSKPRVQVAFIIDTHQLKQYIEKVSSDNLCQISISDAKGVPLINIKGNGDSQSDGVFTVSETSNAFGWKYELVMDPDVTSIQKNEFLFLIIALLCTLIIGPALAVFLAYISYRPLGRMINHLLPESIDRKDNNAISEYYIIENAFSKLRNDNKQMETRIKEYSKYTQNDMLIRLLKGYFYHSEHEKLSYYGIDYSEENHFAVLVISFIENGIKKDDQLQNIMLAGLLIEKILETESVHFKIIDIMEDDVVVILSDCISQLDNNLITRLCENIQTTLIEIEDTEIHIWSGKIEKGILGISKSYHDAKEVENMSLFAKDMQEIIDVTKNFYYPTDWEIQLINNLKMGKEESAIKILDEIQSENVKRMLSKDMQEALYKAMNNTLLRVALELNIDWLEEEVERNKQQYIESRETLDTNGSDKWACIHATCNMICKRTTYQSQENNDISKRILEYIQQNYTNPGLSLKEISSDVSVSLSAASKAFKNAYGINFYDYTCRLRMEKAKELLKESNLAVKDICKEVGYENEFSLRRTFLRYEGISISEYRKSQQR